MGKGVASHPHIYWGIPQPHVRITQSTSPHEPQPVPPPFKKKPSPSAPHMERPVRTPPPPPPFPLGSIASLPFSVGEKRENSTVRRGLMVCVFPCVVFGQYHSRVQTPKSGTRTRGYRQSPWRASSAYPRYSTGLQTPTRIRGLPPNLSAPPTSFTDPRFLRFLPPPTGMLFVSWTSVIPPSVSLYSLSHLGFSDLSSRSHDYHPISSL